MIILYIILWLLAGYLAIKLLVTIQDIEEPLDTETVICILLWPLTLILSLCIAITIFFENLSPKYTIKPFRFKGTKNDK